MQRSLNFDPNAKPPDQLDDFEETLNWLSELDLTRLHDSTIDTTATIDSSSIFALPKDRKRIRQKRTKAELDHLKKEAKDLSSFDPAAIYSDAQRIKSHGIKLKAINYPV